MVGYIGSGQQNKTVFDILCMQYTILLTITLGSTLYMSFILVKVGINTGNFLLTCGSQM